MEILAFIILIFLAIRGLVSMMNLLSGLHLPDRQPASLPKVSILIPARNEESAIGRLLAGLQKLDYPDYEVIVCDDHSADNTEEILNWFAGEDPRMTWFLGEKLPEHWLGKSFACYQLAQRATGQYLVFLDADVELSADAITKAVAYFQQNKLSLLSVFPQQKMETFQEQTIVPVMNWILQSLLPIIFVSKTSFPSLSAANGQFMMFETENYHIHKWHSKVRNQPVEDICLARMVKSEGLKMAVLLGNKDIYCRMYQNLEQAFQGFSRNIHEYFGGSIGVMIGFWLIICLGPFIVWAALGWQYLILFVALVIANRLLVSLASGQPILWNVLLHPLQMINFTVLVFYNIFKRIKKETTWKGRKISLQD